MMRYPHARDKEFETGVSYIANNSNYSILDLPAGGGYLKGFLPTGVKYFGFDFSCGFDDHNSKIIKCDEAKIDLLDESIDVVMNLAGSHHMLD
ncbi:MAG: class I SAM-dependent methyltransferase [Cytophagales bacterium]|nr:class I SAM-dependent methyltransferase [Cytophagales bacterium]